MNSPIRAVRVGLLTLALFLALVAWTGAAAQSVQTGNTEETAAAVKRVYLAAIGDDPDPVPWDYFDPEDPGPPGPALLRKQSSLGSLVIAANFLSCLQGTGWTPCVSTGLDVVAAVSVAGRQPVDRRVQGVARQRVPPRP